MRGTIGEFLIDRLISNGLDTFFGVPGDYTIEFYADLTKRMKLVNCTNELNAGYAADAHARVKGIGCAVVTWCVGGFSISNAIAQAMAESSPVVIISGSPSAEDRNRDVQVHHMVETFDSQSEMFKKITCASAILDDPEKAGFEIDRVLLALHEKKQPVYIEIPVDMINKPISYNPYKHQTPVEKTSDQETLDEAVNEACEYIGKAKKAVLWVGVEMARFGFAKKLTRFAERNRIPIVSSVLGKSVIDETHPLSMGVWCENMADENLKNYMSDCDCLIMLGVMMTTINVGFKPLKYTKRQIIEANTDGIRVKNHSYENVRFVDFTEKLLKQSVERPAPVGMPEKKTPFYSSNSCDQITAERFFEKVNTIITPETSIICDIGDSLFGALGLTVKDNSFISNGFYTSMGFAVPGALGIWHANKTKPLVLVGDGAFQMGGQEFANLVRDKVPATVFVLNNKGYGTERLILDGSFNDIHPWSYCKLVEAYGGVGFLVNTEKELDYACSQAAGINGPVLIEISLGKNDHTERMKRMMMNFRKKTP